MASEILCQEMGGDPPWTNALPVTVQFPWGSMGRQQSSGQHHKSQPQPGIADDMILDGIPKTVDEESFHMSSISGKITPRNRGYHKVQRGHICAKTHTGDGNV